VKLKRNKSFIEANLEVKEGKVYTKEKLIIEFPKWYEKKGLLVIDDVSYLYGIFALIIDNKYSVSIIPTLLPTTPIAVTEVVKDEIEYIQYHYGKGDVIIENTTVVKKEILSFNLFESFFLQARVPWFIEYEDLIRILDNLQKYAKSNLGNNYISTELVVSFITRNKEDKRVFYRQKQDEPYEYIDLMNVYYSAISTISKLAGNYFTESLVSALVQHEDKPNKLEVLIRK